MRAWLIVPVVGAFLIAAARGGSAADKKPSVTGDWTGTWTVQDPPKPGEEQKKNPYPALRLDCKVAEEAGGKWQAVFEGQAGRAYKYTVKMEGRQAGDAVLFQGSADLGPQGGGVYDWIGRATEKEFVGFFTSQPHVGTFRLTRPAAGA